MDLWSSYPGGMLSYAVLYSTVLTGSPLSTSTLPSHSPSHTFVRLCPPVPHPTCACACACDCARAPPFLLSPPSLLPSPGALLYSTVPYRRPLSASQSKATYQSAPSHRTDSWTHSHSPTYTFVLVDHQYHLRRLQYSTHTTPHPPRLDLLSFTVDRPFNRLPPLLSSPPPPLHPAGTLKNPYLPHTHPHPPNSRTNPYTPCQSPNTTTTPTQPPSL